MIQKTLKTTAGKLQVSIPAHLSELKLGQLMAMQSAEHLSDLQAIHILSGIPLATLQNVQTFDELQVFNQQVLALATEIGQLYNSDQLPKAVTFNLNDKPAKVKVIDNLSVEPAGAFMAAREVIAEEINTHIKQHGEEHWQENFNPSLKACSQVLAHYFYCRVTGKPYNEYEAEAFIAQVEQLPVTDALPVAKYFFLSYPNLSKPKTGFWPRLQRRLKSGRVFNRSKSSGISTP
jgi:hypothetical protein